MEILLKDKNFISRLARIVALVITLIVSTVACITLSSCGDTGVKFEPSTGSFGYDESVISEKNSLLGYDNADILIDELSREDGKTKYVYLGWKSCPWCKHYLPYFNNYAMEHDLNLLYYTDFLNVKGYEEKEVDGVWTIDYKNKDQYKKLVDFFNENTTGVIKNNNITGEHTTASLPWIYVPKFIKFENGKFVKFFAPYEWHTLVETTVDGQTKRVLPKFTEEQEAQMLSDVEAFFED